ncbi:MAG: hypothetical protein M3N32_08455 [Actinomycetota bacterium]|nr:hypothetical protein [Actinomycetota bacterium]
MLTGTAPTPAAVGARLAGRAAFAAAAVGYVLAMAWLLQLPHDIAGGVVVGHVLGLVTVPLLLHLTRTEPDRKLRAIVGGGLLLKLFGTLARYFVAFGVYGGGDAFVYDRIGGELAASFRQGDFALGSDQIIGTRFIEIVTGVFYTITGPTRLGGFLFYSWLGFWGLYLFYRAFRISFPEGHRRRYAAMVFFLPSMAFWPSSIGKEAWMTLTLGMAAYGAARLLSHQGHAVPSLLAGLVGSGLVRPHMTITVVVSLGAAYLISGAKRGGFGAPFAKFTGLLVLVAVFGVTFAGVQSKFNLKEGQGLEDVLNKTQTQTSQDGSEFESVAARSPVDVPLAAFSVLFRPLPVEARNVQTLVASLEGAVLLFLFIRHRRKLVNLIPRRTAPYLTFVTAYSLIFVIAFSNFGNFGILARQRVQLFPFVLVLLAVPHIKRKQASPEKLTGITGPRRRVLAQA